MRWLVVHPGPDFSVHDVYAGWVEALRNLGQKVHIYNLNQRLAFYSNVLSPIEETGGPLKEDELRTMEVKRALSQKDAYWAATTGLYGSCYQTWPDVVLLISAFYTPPLVLEVMRARRHKLVLIHTESPYQDEEQLLRAEHADYNILNDPKNIDKYRALGPADYYPHAYRPGLHHPGDSIPEMECDLGFVGTAFDSRIKFFESMDLEGLDVLLAGNWLKLPKDSPLMKYIGTDEIVDGTDNEETVKLYNSAKMGINIYRREIHYGYSGDAEKNTMIGPREVEMAACGLPFLRDHSAEGDDLLSMEPTFEDPDDASGKLRWWLDHPKTRERVAWQAREVIKDRTFENNVKRLMAKLDRM